MAALPPISIKDQPFSVQFDVPDYLCSRAARFVVNEKLENKEDLKGKFKAANARLKQFYQIFMWIPLVIFVCLFFGILWAGGAFKKRISTDGLRCEDKQFLSCRFESRKCKLHSDCPNEQGCIWKTIDCADNSTAVDRSNTWIMDVHDDLCTCEQAMPWAILAATCAAYLVVFTAAYFAYSFLLAYTVWGHRRMRSWVGETLPLEATWEVDIDEQDQCWTTARSTITFKGARMTSDSKLHIYEQSSFGKWVRLPSLFKGSGTSGTGRSMRAAVDAAKKQLHEKNTIEPKPGVSAQSFVFKTAAPNLDARPAGFDDPDRVLRSAAAEGAVLACGPSEQGVLERGEA